MHLFPQVREALLTVMKEAAPRAWVRQCGRFVPMVQRLSNRKALVLDVLSMRFRARAAAFGMKVIAVDCDPVPPSPEVKEVWGSDRLDELLRTSDVVASGLPLTKDTHHIFNKIRINQHIIINISHSTFASLISILANPQLIAQQWNIL